MATWQSDYIIVPITRLRQIYGGIPVILTMEDYTNHLFWQGVETPDEREIERILPPLKSDYPETKLWGTFQGNQISLTYENGLLLDMRLRIDMSRNYQEVRTFVEAIVGLAKKSEWVFLPSNSDAVLQPQYELLAADLKLTEAHKGL